MITIHQSRNVVRLIIAGLAIFILYELRMLLSAILGAIVIFTLFKPLYTNLTERRHWNGKIGALLIILLSLIIIVIPFGGMSFLIADKIGNLSSKPELISQFSSRVNHFFNDPHFYQTKADDIQKWLISIFTRMINSFVNVILNITVMYFILFFMLTDRKVFEKAVEHYLPLNKENTARLRDQLHNITRSNVVGQSIIALTQSICVMTAFYFLHLPDPLFWGFLAAFLAFIPLIGVPSMFIGASVYGFLTGNTTAGIGMLVWGFIVIALIENYLRMYIGRKIAGVHPLITVIGVLIGIPTFGIVGIVFGPLLLSYFILLVNIYEEMMSGRKQRGEISDAKKIGIVKEEAHKKTG